MWDYTGRPPRHHHMLEFGCGSLGEACAAHLTQQAWALVSLEGWSATVFPYARVFFATFLALLLWSVVDPPTPPEKAATPSKPAPATTRAPATTADIAKLNDTISKLTAAVDRLNQQLADRTARQDARQEVYTH